MTREVMEHLSFGNEAACTHDGSGRVAVVHACKFPCHRKAVGYTTISNSHPCYLSHETEYHLYLNLIDPPKPLFMRKSFDAFFVFVDKHVALRPVLIHCNQGESRAPSLALLYVATRTERLPRESYADAAAAFRQEHPYNPGRGIATWLASNWGELS